MRFYRRIKIINCPYSFFYILQCILLQIYFKVVKIFLSTSCNESYVIVSHPSFLATRGGVCVHLSLRVPLTYVVLVYAFDLGVGTPYQSICMKPYVRGCTRTFLEYATSVVQPGCVHTPRLYTWMVRVSVSVVSPRLDAHGCPWITYAHRW